MTTNLTKGFIEASTSKEYFLESSSQRKFSLPMVLLYVVRKSYGEWSCMPIEITAGRLKTACGGARRGFGAVLVGEHALTIESGRIPSQECNSVHRQQQCKDVKRIVDDIRLR